MPNPRVSSSSSSAGAHVMLDLRALKALHQRRSTTDTLSTRFEARRQAVTRAALRRTERGNPVTYRTARRLAAFHGIDVDGLIDMQARPAARTNHACEDAATLERLQCRALIGAVRTARRGRLVDVQGARGAGKSRLLEGCAADARAAGYACAVLGSATRRDTAPHSAAALMLALLDLEDAAALGIERLAAHVQERCWTLGLALAHIEACVSLLEDTRRWPLPAVHLLQTAALCALIQLRARAQPLLIAVDGLHAANWQLTMMLGVLVPGTLEFPVLWLFATERRPAPTLPARVNRLDTLPRTVLHLETPPVCRNRADAASVHRIGRAAYADRSAVSAAG
jgi:hypothetical protein